MKTISSEDVQKSISGLEDEALASGYTLLESLLLILLLTTILSLPVLAFSAWGSELAAYQFLGQLEKRIYPTQEIAIVNQIQTGFYRNSEENQIIFYVPDPDKVNWEVLDIPDEITLKRHASITFAARTGNENSLEAYQFCWGEKEWTITYQFQIGNGRYTKGIEQNRTCSVRVPCSVYDRFCPCLLSEL